ncbi:type II secretion system protein GspD [Haloferula sp.]|uniref:type II secretion system protein GspD n=1 Tax=Haloferula sp. TaxID=2497595 RepID=UPI003C77B097
MKMKSALLIAACFVLPSLSLHGQDEANTPGGDLSPPVDAGLPDLPPPPAPPAPGSPGDVNLPIDGSSQPGGLPPLPTDQPGFPPVEPVTPPSEPINATGAEEGTEQQIQESDEGYLIKDASLNDIFQFLAKQAGRQYFHNVKIATPEYRVTGHLNDGNPLQQMEELAFMYGLMLYTKGNTVYALTQAQLSQLPNTEFTYQLKYLRPTDIEQIKALIQPVLTPGTGIVNFEPKTNTIIIIDTSHRIEQARSMLHNIDKQKSQIIVETKILRVNSEVAERTGIDWSGSLGKDGTAISLSRDLNSVFGLPSSPASSIPGGADTNLVLSPIELDGVLRALAEGALVTQISNPTLITEDNEQGSISIIDRVPIITTTTNQGTGDVSSVSEEVRYKIDASDPSITEEPDKHREIGISMVVTPQLLPDSTIRMSLRPRSAQIVEEIVSAQTGNRYPRVTESMIESISRVPDGHSLVVGGFYGEADSKKDNKVPILGDIPFLNFFFKSSETTKEQSSLVFIVTPSSYDPTSIRSTGIHSNQIHTSLSLTRDHDWVDPQNPGPAYEPNLRRSLRGLEPQPAPYYPRTDEMPTEQPVRARGTSPKSLNSSPVEAMDSSAGSSPTRFSRARRR